MAIRVMIEGHTGNTTQQVMLEETIPIGQLLPALISALKLPIVDREGHPVTYRIGFNGRNLQEYETLLSADVTTDDTITLLPEINIGRESFSTQEADFPTIKVKNRQTYPWGDTWTSARANISHGSTIRILITEEPLTAYNLNIIISSLIEIHTKFWLIQQQRYTDVISFSQTHNPRFVEEANLLIGKMAHNSPGWLDFITASGPLISEALKTVTTIMQTPLQLQATVLDNEAKELELRLKEQTAEAELADKNQNRQIDAQRAALENQRGQLELEEKRLELIKKRLEIQELQLELEKKRVEVTLEIAHKAVDVFPLEIDAVTKSMLAEILLPNILHLSTAKGAKLILSEPSQDDESENAGGV